MELKERMQKAVKHADKMSDAEIARRVTNLISDKKKHKDGIPAQTIQAIRKGTTKTSTYIPHIAHVLGVSAIWLSEEVGEMVPKLDANKVRYGTMLNTFLTLPKNARHHIRGIIEEFGKIVQ